MPIDMPAAEVEITEDLVRALIRRQVPHLSSLPVRRLANGWDNALFRIGDELLARFPRRAVAVQLIESEQRWLPMLALRLPLPIPAPIHAGAPDLDFPWPWSIVPFLPGESALARFDRGEELTDPIGDAERLGRFFAALHQPATDNAPHNPYRGGPLTIRADRNREMLVRLRGIVDVDALGRLWTSALTRPAWSGPAMWLHGDPHPGNMIVDDDGRLHAVIDFGDITAGDPATDLAAAWMLLPREARPAFRDAVDTDDDTWARAHGWALSYGLVMVGTSADNPLYTRLGHRVLEAVLTDVPD